MMWNAALDDRRSRFATQANAKSFVLELELRQSVLAQQRDQLAQLVHVDGSCGLSAPARARRFGVSLCSLGADI